VSSVLVTGAGGFVGSAIVRRLVQGGARFWDGAPVEHVAAVLRPGGSTERLEELPERGRWSIERADTRDSASLGAVLEHIRPRAVVHAALDSSVYVEDAERLVRGPLESLLDGLSATAGSRFLHVGSAWVLASGDWLDESAPIAPLAPYARNKAREDALLPGIAGAAGVPWINLRLFNLFGRYEKPARLLPSLVAKLSRGETVALSHGGQIRDFTDVDRAAQAFLDALAAPEEACSAVYHIGSGCGTSVRALALMVAGMVGSRAPIQFGASESEDEDVPVLVADPSRATRVLGWRPDPDLEACVRSAVEWWLERLGTPAGRELTV